jgi:hypothetical protein
MLLRERGELATEAMAAFTLLNAVADAYARHELDAFVALNAIAGVALAVVVIRGMIRMRRHHDAGSTGTNVVGVFGGLATVVEGLHRLHSAHFTFGRHHFALGILTIFAGLLTTTVALLMERLEHGRALSITDDGIRMQFNKFRRFNVHWPEIAELKVDAKEARLVRMNGNARVVPLRRLLNRDDVVQALIEAVLARGIAVSGASASTSPLDAAAQAI